MSDPQPRPRPLVFGEVLFDCFPDGSQVLGGAPFNVAWHLQALGLNPWLVSGVGSDAAGDEVLSAMRRWGMDVSGIQRSQDHPTGQVEIRLADGQPSYAILADQAYDAIQPPPAAAGDIALIYHGTLALRRPSARAALGELRQRLRAPVFVDVNLRAPWWHPQTVADLLCEARWCKLNDIELASLAGPGDPRKAARRLIERHGLEQVFVTLGAAGAFALGADGTWARIAPAPDITLVDTVGAGDAFAAVLIAGLLQAWPTPVTLERAQTLASAVCGLRGALPTEPGLYQDLLALWENA